VPVTGDLAKAKALARNLRDLADPKGRAQQEISREIVREVRGLLREQFAAGVGPYGMWPLTVRGKPALVSRKLPQDFRGEPVPGGVRFWWGGRARWIRAHHEGHVFPARQAGGQSLFFNEKGQLLRLGKLTVRGLRTKFVMERVARAHTVGQRVLPKREIYPDRGVGSSPTWAAHVNHGARLGMQRWRERATR
jgi:hypothetical protein